MNSGGSNWPQQNPNSFGGSNWPQQNPSGFGQGSGSFGQSSNNFGQQNSGFGSASGTIPPYNRRPNYNSGSAVQASVAMVVTTILTACLAL